MISTRPTSIDSHVLVLLHEKLVRPEVSLENVLDLKTHGQPPPP